MPVQTDMYSQTTFRYERSLLVNDNVRVYKGGSWKDRAYWLVPVPAGFYRKTNPETIWFPLCNDQSRITQRHNQEKIIL